VAVLEVAFAGLVHCHCDETHKSQVWAGSFGVFAQTHTERRNTVPVLAVAGAPIRVIADVAVCVVCITGQSNQVPVDGPGASTSALPTFHNQTPAHYILSCQLH